MIRLHNPVGTIAARFANDNNIDLGGETYIPTILLDIEVKVYQPAKTIHSVLALYQNVVYL